MIRVVDNPPNPWQSRWRHWLEPPLAHLEVFEERARSVLTENDSPDIPFRWSVNPYRGCQHACAYCYARPYHEYLDWGAGTDFDTRIVVKVNAAEVLRRDLRRPSLRGEWITFSGVTDCYQPLEACYGITRACLEVCREYGNPVSVVTKSYLVMRDADVLADLAAGPGAAVYQSVTFADDALARLVEPHAPPPSRRLEAMRRLKEAGVPVGVLIAPVIPGLNDRQIPRIVELAAQAGARWAGIMPLRLPGSVGEVFLERIRQALPHRAGRIESRIREMRGGRLNESAFGARMRGRGQYWESIEELFRLTASRFGLGPIGQGCRQMRHQKCAALRKTANPPTAAQEGRPPEAAGAQNQLRLPLRD